MTHGPKLLEAVKEKIAGCPAVAQIEWESTQFTDIPSDNLGDIVRLLDFRDAVTMSAVSRQTRNATMTPRALGEHLQRLFGMNVHIFRNNGGFPVQKVWRWLSRLRCLGCNVPIEIRTEAMDNPYVASALYKGVDGGVKLDKLTCLCRSCNKTRRLLIEKVKSMCNDAEICIMIDENEDIQDTSRLMDVTKDLIRALMKSGTVYHELVLTQRYILDFPIRTLQFEREGEEGEPDYKRRKAVDDQLFQFFNLPLPLDMNQLAMQRAILAGAKWQEQGACSDFGPASRTRTKRKREAAVAMQ
jgi:hypothetical protein